MQINFYADLRQLVGGKTVNVEIIKAMTARTALQVVTHTRPALAEKIWNSAGELYDHIHVFINGRQSVHLAQGLETPVQDEDTLDVFPPVGGGGATRVTLKFTGEVWARMQRFALDFAFEGNTLDDLLRALFAQYAVRDVVLDERDQFIFRSGILVNGRSAKWLGGLNAPIHDGDEVILMRPSVAAV